MSDLFELLVDLHIGGERQGPGSDAATRRAIDLARIAGRAELAVADIGCGTGASTFVLAEELDCSITAVDLMPPFLEVLGEEADRRGMSDRITTAAVSMEELGFEPGSLDVIWAEGSIYNIGFDRGIRLWRPLLKPGGVLAVSEITWLTSERPPELEQHWNLEYPEIATASSKLLALETAGYSPIGYFTLPASCWLENYYRPLQARFDGFLERHSDTPGAREIVEAERGEIDLYERFGEYFGYGFYIAARLPE